MAGLEPPRRARAGDERRRASTRSTVRLNLSAPFSPLLAALADRAGMMVSPKAAQAAGDKFGAKPVCSGPFKFVERVRAGPHRARALPELLEQGRRSTSTRSSTRRSPMRRCASRTCARASSTSSSAWRPRDVAGARRATSSFKIAQHHRDRLPGHHHQRRQERPGAEEPARQGRAGARGVRARRSTAQGIVQVVMDGEATVGNQWVAPSNAYYAKNVPVPEARRRARQGAAEGSGRAEPELHAGDADHLGRAAHRAGGAGDGASDAGFDVKIQVDRIRDLAQHGRQGRLRGLRAGLERPRRPRRQPATASTPASSRSTTPATAMPEVDELLNQSRAQRDPAERKKMLRADRRAGAEGPADRLPLPPQLAVGLQRQARRPAQHPRRPAARAAA